MEQTESYKLPEITDQTGIAFHKLRFGKPDRKGNAAIVRWTTDSTIIANDVTLQIVKLLIAGKTIGEVKNTLQLETQNLIGIIGFLCAQGFVRNINEKIFPETKSAIHPWLPKVRRRWFSWVISWPFLMIVIYVISFGLVIAVFNPGYIPNYTDYYWTDNLLLVLLTKNIISFIGLILHETAHFTTTKAVGGQAVMRFSNRYIYLVAETEHYHLALVPRKKRLYVYWAGIVFDLFSVAAIISLFYFWDLQQIDVGLLRSLLKLFIIKQLISIAWEFGAFLETDVYNSLTEVLDQPNLSVDARKFLWNKIRNTVSPPLVWIKNLLRTTFLSPRITDEADDMRIFTKKEKRTFLIYAIFYVWGILLTSLSYIFFTLPFLVTVLIKIVQEFMDQVAANETIGVPRFLLTLFLALIEYILLLLVIVGKGRKKEAFLK